MYLMMLGIQSVQEQSGVDYHIFDSKVKFHEKRLTSFTAAKTKTSGKGTQREKEYINWTND